MDIGMLRDEEHFSTFDSINFLDEYSDEMSHLEDIKNFPQNDYEWGLENEREINGDIALIPVCDMNLTKFNDSPPNVDEFHKIVNDWQQFLNVDPATELSIDESITQFNQKIEPLDPNTSNFDITKYLIDVETPDTNFDSRKCKAGVKKIDLRAQRYIIDEEDEVDVETISECDDNSPVLEAKDLHSLLEQFEATQIPELPTVFIKNESDLVNNVENETASKCNEILKNVGEKIIDEPFRIKEEINIKEAVEVKKEILDEGCGSDKMNDKNVMNRNIDKPIITEDEDSNCTISKTVSLPNKKGEKPNSTPIPKLPNATPDTPKPTSQTASPKSSQTTPRPPRPPSEATTSLIPNKQIIDSLPEELIARIKESGKRKPISVIPPIPAKKRGGPRMQDAAAQLNRNKMIKLGGMETVQLDHDYCSSIGKVEAYPKNPKKDSGFESAEEDDRTVIGKQPTVKTADGKLMVSLLKVNTIHTPKTDQQKKKLNLEEYKKRREGFLKSQNNSQNSSPISSTCSSPLPEDENTKLLKHQEKLMRMAREVLNTPPKSCKKSGPQMVITPPVPKQIPNNMEMKTLVSIGVNTDFKVSRKNVDPLAQVERLDEMKPLLQKASAKINGNSLITSVIETIPKLIDSCEPGQSKCKSTKDKNSKKDKTEHGEDKTIVYLPKNRASVKTKTVECQTNISLIQQTKDARYRRRRRQSSGSSTSSQSSRDSRSRDRSSNNSRCSSRSSKSSRSSNSTRSISSYSSRTSSRSRSRSISPKYSRKDKERLREVEERRVIYVGRIPPGTTRDDLKKRFQIFGVITNVSLHSRDHSYYDNYGFVTFANKLDAYEAIEHGNDDPWQPKYDLSFGGRRIFCQTSYSDLDNMRDECGYFAQRSGANDSFDNLLREVQEKLRKRKA